MITDAVTVTGGTRLVGLKKDKGVFEFGSVADPCAGGSLPIGATVPLKIDIQTFQ